MRALPEIEMSIRTFRIAFCCGLVGGDRLSIAAERQQSGALVHQCRLGRRVDGQRRLYPLQSLFVLGLL